MNSYPSLLKSLFLYIIPVDFRKKHKCITSLKNQQIKKDLSWANYLPMILP